MQFLEITKKTNLPRMMSIQNVYSLVNRVFDIANSEVSINQQCGLLAYSPLAGGRLSGKYINNQHPENAVIHFGHLDFHDIIRKREKLL